MSDRDDDGGLDDWLRHPWASVSAGLGLAGHGLGVVDPVGLLGGVFSIVVGTAGTWFPLLGVIRHLGGLVAFIPAALAENAFVVGGLLYASYLALTLVGSWTDRLRQLLKRDTS